MVKLSPVNKSTHCKSKSMIIFTLLLKKTHGNRELSITIPEEFLHQPRDTNFVYHPNIETESAPPNLDIAKLKNLLNESDANKKKLEAYNHEHMSKYEILKLKKTKITAMKEVKGQKEYITNIFIWALLALVGVMFIMVLCLLIIIYKLL